MSRLICLLHEGDSIAASNIGYFYQYLNVAAADSAAPATPGETEAQANPAVIQSYSFISGEIIARNLAIGGSRLQTNSFDLAQRAPTWVDPVIPSNASGGGSGGSAPVPRRYYILTVAIGSNDQCIGGFGTVAEWIAAYVAYLAARKAAAAAKGWNLYTGMTTVLPRNDVLQQETNRAIFNGTITAPGWAAAHGVDVIIDLASEPTMGLLATCSDASKYFDGIHPAQAGHALLKPIYAAAVDGLIAGLA